MKKILMGMLFAKHHGGTVGNEAVPDRGRLAAACLKPMDIAGYPICALPNRPEQETAGLWATVSELPPRATKPSRNRSAPAEPPEWNMTHSDENSTFNAVCPVCGHTYRVPENCRGKQLACKGCGTTFSLHLTPGSGSAPAGSQPPADPPETVGADDAGLVVGKLAVKHRFLDEDQLREALALQREEEDQGKRSLLGSILVRQGLITQKQLDFLLSVQMIMETRKLDRQFGEISVRNGFARKEDVEAALGEQERLFKEDRSIRLIGEILVDGGKMDPGHRDAVLERQKRMVSGETEPDHTSPRAAVEPSPPEMTVAAGETGPCEELFQIAVSPDGLSASITPKSPVPDSVSAANLKAFLQSREIVHGLLTDPELEAFLREGARTGHAFVVARGTPSQPGRDAEIRYHFDTDPLKVGTIKEGGGIDFKDRGDIPQVAEGDLLAERIPPEEGVPGTDVSGRPVAPPKPKGLKLRKGRGAVFSEDGLRLFAELPGRPEISADGKVFVFSEHKVPGDVDLKSGHVEFEGDIQVAGTIQKGFRVRGGSLTANEIMGAEIDIRGDVVVTGGIIGADIRVGGNLRARYVHKSRIRTFGDVIVEKEVIDADVETSGAFIVMKGPVFSSRVAAKKGVEAVQVGSTTSNPCLLIVGTDERVKNELQGFQDRIDVIQEVRNTIQETLDGLDKQKQQIALELGKVAQMQDASNVKKRQIEEKIDAARKSGDEGLLKKIRQAVSTLESEMREREETLEAFFAREDAVDENIAAKKEEMVKLASEAEALEGEIEHLNEWSKSEAPIPVVKVFGSIFPYTVIKGRHTSLTLPKEHKAVRIKETHYDEPRDGKEWKLRLSPLKK